MRVRFWAATAVAAMLAAGSAAAEDAGDPAAVKAAVDYCLAVSEAKLEKASPLADGPAGFERLTGPYGGQTWLKGGMNAPGSIAVAPGDGQACAIVANDIAAEDIALLVRAEDGYRANSDRGNDFVRTVEGGAIRVVWSRNPIGKATFVSVQAIPAEGPEVL